MAVEVATFVEQLNPAWPASNDEIPEGDDHIRLTKGTLQTQFPNLGIAVAVNPTAAELNFMVGVTLGVQFQLDALSVRIDGNDTELADHETRIAALEGELIAPATTKMLFPQAAVPTGWTLDATNDDKVIRVDGVAGGTTAGSWTITGLTVDGHTLTSAQIPPHQHVSDIFLIEGNAQVAGAAVSSSPGSASTIGTRIDGGGGGSHTHGLTADGTWRPAYLDVVVGTKD